MPDPVLSGHCEICGVGIDDTVRDVPCPMIDREQHDDKCPLCDGSNVAKQKEITCEACEKRISQELDEWIGRRRQDGAEGEHPDA